MANRDITSLLKFYSSTTVRGHGQTVIPAEVRRELGIKRGTKLLVFVPFHHQGLVLLKAEAIQQIQQLLNSMTTQLGEFDKLTSQSAQDENKTTRENSSNDNK